ncbi:MAG: hypothetical protein ACI8W8_002635 [Rhodothermales bacterium]|jgi:hypothetical protein
MKRLIMFAVACGFVLLAGYGAWRISKRPEYLIRYGTPEEQVWAVRQFGLAGELAPALRALDSPVPSVRHAAIAALEGLRALVARKALLKLARRRLRPNRSLART